MGDQIRVIAVLSSFIWILDENKYFFALNYTNFVADRVNSRRDFQWINFN